MSGDNEVAPRRVRVPASSANLGPGFDTLGLALALYTDISIEPSPEFSLHVTGEGSSLRRGLDHLAARVVTAIVGHTRFALEVHSSIPMTRGLGSSAAMVVAAAAAAGHEDPLAYAALLEGHGDNAAAAVLGGLVTAHVDTRSESVSAIRLPLDPALQFVVVIPDRHLRTADARSVLPETVALGTVTEQLASLAATMAGLADHRVFNASAMRDRLHQAQRGTLFPEAAHLLQTMTDAGALGSCWSGAGPSLLGVCTDATAEVVRVAAERALASFGIAGRAEVITADMTGLVVEPLLERLSG